MRDRLSACLGEHHDQVAVAEVTKRMGESDVGYRCLHSQIRCDDAQSPLVGGTIEKVSTERPSVD